MTMLVNQAEREPKAAALSSDEMWTAVTRRDGSYDGVFYFGVRSTGAFCKPSCAAKRPLRDHVVFLSNLGEAKREGFRACLRCKPEEAAADARGKVQEACLYIRENPDRRVSLGELGERVGMSPFHFQRVFKRLVGVSPRQFSEATRLERMKLSLKNGESVRKSIYGSGYNSTSWLYERPDTRLGMAPSAYKGGGEGQQVLYAVVNCPLGRLLVAGTEKGICAVSLGDSDATLERFLKGEYPKAQIERDERGVLSNWVASIVKYLEGQSNARIGDLPLDVQATAFEYRVWRELQAIPYGSTRSYSDIAERIQQPRAVRAVANACAKNPTCLIVPCHRVVRKNGDLGGYRWGIERKRKLLAMETGGEKANVEAWRPVPT